MASLQKQYSDSKLQGVVYTPLWVVDKILDSIGYQGTDILGKDILDPACGDGRFLVQVVRRILAISPKKDRTKNLQYVYGWDIDPIAVEACKRHLNTLIAEYGLVVDWNISVQNAILQYENTLFTGVTKKYDFIVGNPPYIRIQHLDLQTRKLLRERFSLCKTGSTDIFVAFFELAYGLLRPAGICGFITPNSYIRTNTAKPLRDFFVQNQAIKEIHNFGAVQIFEGFSAYTAITVLTKKSQRDISIYKYSDKTTYDISVHPYFTLQGQLFWDFSDNSTTKGVKLKHIAHIFTGIATLCDKVFVSKLVRKKGDIWVLKNKLFGIIELEKDILKPIVKASRYKQDNQAITEYILYPYVLQDSKANIIPESKLKKEYPLAYAYLCTARHILDKRDAGKKNPVAWYAYGRSQGLTNGTGQKIIFSPMAKQPSFYICDNKDALLYSGYGMKSDVNLKTLQNYLNSEKLKTYIQQNGADFAGNWKGYNKTILQEFVIE